jgi:hypothetical protein
MSLTQLKECRYITSVGMLLSLDDNNIITYNKEPHKITHDFNKLLNGKDGDCIYIKFAFFREFVYRVFPQLNYRFILITGDGDETMPDDLIDLQTFNNIINDDKVIHWYSVNCNENYHEKFSLIPIGVNFHSLTFGEFCGWSSTSMTPKEQESMLDNIRIKSGNFDEKIPKCYSNFHFVTYTEFNNPRQDAINKISKELIYYEPSLVDRETTWTKNSEYAFTVSPMGHGMDCHRTWEALMLGTIVIVKKSKLDSLYDELPVLIVNDWDDITQDLLFKTIEEFKKRKFNYEKITLKYWVDKIRNTKY